MTRSRPIEIKCALCGTDNEVMHLDSTNTSGPNDLDTRPSEMMRSTMHTWVQSCSNCGYSSKDITIEIPGAREIIASEEYKQILNNHEVYELARKFLSYALILKKTGNIRKAIDNTLFAAWDCDDYESVNASAKKYRIEALLLIDSFDPGCEDKNLELLKIDLLRRTDQFEKAIAFAKKIKTEEDTTKLVLYQIRLCENKDNKAHTFGEI